MASSNYDITLEGSVPVVQLAGLNTNKNAVFNGSVTTTGTLNFSASTGLVLPLSPIYQNTISDLGTAQNSTPTAAQLLGGVVTQTSATGAGTVTLPTGTLLSAAVSGVAAGYTFDVLFANLGGGQTLTITGATGSTVIGSAGVGTGKNAMLTFVNTGTNTWNVYVVVSA